MNITYNNTTFENTDELVEIRISSMKESLERIGRFDPQRARERFVSSFDPENTKYIVLNGSKVGFIVVKLKNNEVALEHLYIKPEYQNKGVGSVVLQTLLAEADSNSLAVTVGALRESASNRFYQYHGFTKTGESEWDIYYIHEPKTKL